MKLAIISRHPAPYRDPLLHLISADKRFCTEIFNEMDIDRGHDFWDLKRHGYSAQPLYPTQMNRIVRMASLIRRFVFGRYDFVLWAGFNTVEMICAMFVSAVLKRRYGFMADTVEQRPASWLKRQIKRLIAKNAALIFVPGEKGIRFWSRNYGINSNHIVKGAYALDGGQMAREIATLRKMRHSIRSGLGISKRERVYLMVANMIPRRHYPITVSGFLRFAERNRDGRFVIVGKGPDLIVMQEVAKNHPELIVVPGCSFDEMKGFYAMADVYVHGGKEPASTALVIGAIAGLPLISSDAVGCAADVLEDGRSGVRVPNYLSESDWAEAFGRMHRHSDLQALGKRARELSKQLDVSVAYNDFVLKISRNN